MPSPPPLVPTCTRTHGNRCVGCVLVFLAVQGNGPFGYDTDNDMLFETAVDFGDKASFKHITTYFRTEFRLITTGEFQSATLQLRRDDGAVVYLNGREIARSNMAGGGTVTFDTKASRAAGPKEEGFFLEIEEVDVSALAPGVNVLAVEVHQSDRRSSDMAFDAELTLHTNHPRLVKGPYYSIVTPTSAVFRWETDQPVASAVVVDVQVMDLETGRLPDVSNAVVVNDRVTMHEVTVTGLQPSTRYYYAVMVGPGDSPAGAATTPDDLRTLAGASPYVSFRTAPLTGQAPATGSTRLMFTGDPGTGDANALSMRDAWRRWLAGAGKGDNLPVDVWVTLGDNAYPDGTAEEFYNNFFAMYSQELLTTAVWPVYGNHDGHSSYSPAQKGPYFDAFALPRQAEAGGVPSNTAAYYSFDHGNVHVVVLDSYDSPRECVPRPLLLCLLTIERVCVV